MAENRPTGPGAPPVRTLLHRGLPEPLPRRPSWVADFLTWFPLLVLLMIALPAAAGLMYAGAPGDSPAPLPIVLALLAGLSTYVYELGAAVRRRRRR